MLHFPRAADPSNRRAWRLYVPTATPSHRYLRSPALREGGPDDVVAYVDGALLVDLWRELVLPPRVRAAWDGVVSGEVDEQVS
jgi:hypothetical protein